MHRVGGCENFPSSGYRRISMGIHVSHKSFVEKKQGPCCLMRCLEVSVVKHMQHSKLQRPLHRGALAPVAAQKKTLNRV